jgi:poly(ADP-ribose) glycohydrolase
VPESDSIVTGNWGCGAFRGNLQLKFLIQWIGCSMAEKRMIYCPYGKK